jgi:hypothetical protein
MSMQVQRHIPARNLSSCNIFVFLGRGGQEDTLEKPRLGEGMGRLCGPGTAAAPFAAAGNGCGADPAAAPEGAPPLGCPAVAAVAAAERLASFVPTPGAVTGCCCDRLKRWVPGSIAPHFPLHLQAIQHHVSLQATAYRSSMHGFRD